ncbi:hypothetical protein NDU88_004842 [Pleurodeles waltl]|uniref:Uncharacterized protein n=1 Tax=Pleurodeles waltl TaxID=8319 RepID=A0AAV7PE96_PLEWA|nr:hypothetical protein NDU88_004842 [Pleurodeles waltl]
MHAKDASEFGDPSAMCSCSHETGEVGSWDMHHLTKVLTQEEYGGEPFTAVASRICPSLCVQMEPRQLHSRPLLCSFAVGHRLKDCPNVKCGHSNVKARYHYNELCVFENEPF